MKTDELKAWATRQPFRPFTINLNSGDTILIDTPEAILLPQRKPELVIAFSLGGQMHLFEFSVISSLTELSQPSGNHGL